MGERIPQSIAKRVPLWAFLASDHVTPATGKTIAITISKNGGAFANPAAGATNATAIANGWYYVDLGTGDTNTLGPLVIRGAEGTIDDVGIDFTIVDAANGGLSNLDATISSRASPTNITAGTITTATNVTTVNGLAANVITAASINADAITAAKIANGAIDAATFATGAIDAAALAADAGTEIGTAVWATAARTLTAGTNIVLAKGVGVTGFNDISSADVTAAVPTAAAITTAVHTTVMAESYAANGAAATLAQAVYAIQQYNLDRDVTGTAMTVRRIDHTTQAMVLTLDSATTPTDINRTA